MAASGARFGPNHAMTAAGRVVIVVARGLFSIRI